MKHVLHIGLDGLHASCFLNASSGAANIMERLAYQGSYTLENARAVVQVGFLTFEYGHKHNNQFQKLKSNYADIKYNQCNFIALQVMHNHVHYHTLKITSHKTLDIEKFLEIPVMVRSELRQLCVFPANLPSHNNVIIIRTQL